MRHRTAKDIVDAYETWRDARPGTNEARSAKDALDDRIRAAVREEMVERAHATAEIKFVYVGDQQDWSLCSIRTDQPTDYPTLLR